MWNVTSVNQLTIPAYWLLWFRLYIYWWYLQKHFRLLLFNRFEKKQVLTVMYTVCVFSCRLNTRMAFRYTGLFYTLLLQPLNGIRRNFTRGKHSTSCSMFVFLLEDKDGRPGLWWMETLSASPLQPLIGTWKKARILQSQCFGAIKKIKTAALASDWLGFFLLLLCSWTGQE